MADKVYIHYGSTKFDPELIKPFDYYELGHISSSVKPPFYSGLWGSPVDSENSWKAWNDSTEYSECDDNNTFRFRVKDGFKILMIDSPESAISLVENYLTVDYVRLRFGVEKQIDPDSDVLEEKLQCIDFIRHGSMFEWRSIRKLDFIKMQNDGYAGMEISLTAFPKLYYLLYRWDCDSIVVWNPDAIEKV